MVECLVHSMNGECLIMAGECPWMFLQRTSVDLTFFEVSFLQTAQAHLNLKQMTWWLPDLDAGTFHSATHCWLGTRVRQAFTAMMVSLLAVKLHQSLCLWHLQNRLKASTFPYIEAADGNNQVEHEAGWLREWRINDAVNKMHIDASRCANMHVVLHDTVWYECL